MKFIAFFMAWKLVFSQTLFAVKLPFCVPKEEKRKIRNFAER